MKATHDAHLHCNRVRSSLHVSAARSNLTASYCGSPRHWGSDTCCQKKHSDGIWGFPEIGLPRTIIQFSRVWHINHPASYWGTPFLETPILIHTKLQTLRVWSEYWLWFIQYQSSQTFIKNDLEMVLVPATSCDLNHDFTELDDGKIEAGKPYI